MNSLASWQLLLFLYATTFGEPLTKVAPVETPEPTGQRLGPLGLLAPWELGPRCEEKKPASRLRPRGVSPCPPLPSSAGRRGPEPCAARSRLIPAPRGAVLVQREKDPSAYNWNSFGLRYGRRRAAGR